MAWNMTNKVVLLTGGMGYVGSVLTRLLLEQGYNVRILEKFIFGLDSIKEIINHPDLEIVIGDIIDKEDLGKFFEVENIYAVIHLAGLVGDPACAININKTMEVNYIATLNLVRFCREKRIQRFIFASSCSVYGASNHEILNEDSALNPISLYSETKIDAEKNILSFSDPSFRPTILRFATLYGDSYRMRFDLVINYLTGRLFHEGNGKIFGGDQWRPFIHVKDIARAIGFVLKKDIGEVGNQIFNVGSSDENYMLKDLIPIFRELMPEADIEILKTSM